MLHLGVCGLLQGVGFGLCGEAQVALDVGRRAGLGAFAGEDLCFEFALGQAADDVGFVADLQGSKYCLRMVSSSGLLRCGSGETACSGLVIPAASR